MLRGSGRCRLLDREQRTAAPGIASAIAARSGAKTVGGEAAATVTTMPFALAKTVGGAAATVTTMPFALALTVVLALLSLFQVALALGAPLGKFAWGGAHRVLPTKLRMGSLVSVAIYAVIASLAWFRVGVAPLGEGAATSPGRFVVVAMWLVFANFCAAIVLNALSRSRAERAVMVPTSIVLAALSGVIALG